MQQKLKNILLEKGFNKYDFHFYNENKLRKQNNYVLYWMQEAQRIQDNKALTAAGLLAKKFNLPLLVGFVFIPEFPEGNKRHFSFMYDGIMDVKDKLENRKIDFIIKVGSPVNEIRKLAENASLIICDSGYLKPARNWRKTLAKKIEIPLLEISTNLIVPAEEASEKEEYAAHTLRKKLSPKIESHLNIWNLPDELPACKNISKTPKLFDDKNMFLDNLNLTNNTPNIEAFNGGHKHAKKKLNEFLKFKLPKYENKRSDPDYMCESDLSPYLHFGHISPREIAIKASGKAEENDLSIDEFWDELIIRRELSFNFIYYNRQYDKFPDFLPDWAQKTLKKHWNDEREYIYSRQEFETASTHDKYWNAAQLELIYRGKIHNYMRMYWGKKILEWSKNPDLAFDICLYLNNKYALDGRDPNSYAGVAWCFGKHDRAWKERKIYGKTRYMNRNGLERKFKLKDYTNRIKNLAEIKSLPGN